MATVEEVMEEVRRKASEREEGLRDITSDAHREYTNAASRSATAESNFMQNEDAMNRARAAARAAAKEKAALRRLKYVSKLLFIESQSLSRFWATFINKRIASS